MKKVLQNALAGFAKTVIEREKPLVVGVTGSVGKTSTKEAIGAVLGGSFKIRVSPKNYNNELGLPLAILGLKSGGKSLFGWLGAFLRGWRAAMMKAAGYPKILVLEMGVDRPGDLAKLMEIASPAIGVVTAVGEAHAEFFGSMDEIAKEKRTLVEKLPREGFAILNRDDDRVWSMAGRTRAKTVSFGFHDEADVRAIGVSMNYAFGDEPGEAGVHLKISYKGSMVPVFLPDVLGKQGIYAALAAAAVGLVQGLNLVEISDRLRGFVPPPGRMRAIPGIKWTMLIDDTYNASPMSAFAALDVLRQIPVASGDDKKFAVLGDMLELGPLSVQGHMDVGRMAVDCADTLVFVGEKMGDAEKAALGAGAPADSVFHFGSPEEAGRFVQDRMKKGDVVLVKGSQGMRMERVVKELMADPLAAPKLLVRQDADWV